MSTRFNKELALREQTTPTTSPAAGTRWFYLKTDGKLYTKDSAGVETAVASAGGASGGGPPTGSMLMYAAATAPTGYLLCDGAAVSRTTYADLFAVIGTTYGTGDGTTTFNVPDFQVRVPVGAGTGKTLGASDGVAETSRNANRTHSHGHGSSGSGSVSLTSGAGSSHSHSANTYTASSHTHTIGTSTGGSTTAASGTAVTLPTKAYVDGHTHGGNTGGTSTGVTGTSGSEASHTHSVSGGVSVSTSVSSNTTPESPFTVVNYIIKYQ